MRGHIPLAGIIGVLCMSGYEPPRLYIRTLLHRIGICGTSENAQNANFVITEF
jgi:hypothetical protein